MTTLSSSSAYIKARLHTKFIQIINSFAGDMCCIHSYDVFHHGCVATHCSHVCICSNSNCESINSGLCTSLISNAHKCLRNDRIYDLTRVYKSDRSNKPPIAARLPFVYDLLYMYFIRLNALHCSATPSFQM